MLLVYVDMLVDNIPAKFKEVFHFQPADEPLLRFAFEDGKYREELKGFNKINKRLWLPKPELLLATKLNALKMRDKEHKKIKDICDIFALLWYSKEKPQELQKKVAQFLPAKEIPKIISIIDETDFQKASVQLNHTPPEIKRVIKLLG